MPQAYSAFSVYGIELEYMIVNSKTLKVCPIADKILQELNGGEICNEIEIGRVSWSNELVNHVLEIKCTTPEKKLDDLDVPFHKSINNIQSLLEKYDCSLLPTAMNPWFNPSKETMLWPHDQREIYNLYNEIFDCKGHGWSNLQSVHINLPYANEVEFVALHSAIRIVLPLIPYLAASSPFFDGSKGALADNRLAFYEKNQARIPSIIGNIIPENVKSIKEYKTILQGIYKDISHFDNAKTLQNPWLNSRAAIPKFDVGAIEIRLMDIQESPYMDFTIVQLIVQMVKYVFKANDSLKDESMFTDAHLRMVYEDSKEFNPKVDLERYNKLFDLPRGKLFSDFRKNVIEKFKPDLPTKYHQGLDILATKGSLSQRLCKNDLSIELYKKLQNCLRENIPYDG